MYAYQTTDDIRENQEWFWLSLNSNNIEEVSDKCCDLYLTLYTTFNKINNFERKSENYFIYFI